MLTTLGPYGPEEIGTRFSMFFKKRIENRIIQDVPAYRPSAHTYINEHTGTEKLFRKLFRKTVPSTAPKTDPKTVPKKSENLLKGNRIARTLR